MDRSATSVGNPTRSQGVRSMTDPAETDIPTTLIIARGVVDSMEKYPSTCAPGDARAIRNLIAAVESLRAHNKRLTDPAEMMDLEEIQARWDSIPRLVAEVEALRERVAELEAAVARRGPVREYTREPFTISKDAY